MSEVQQQVDRLPEGERRVLELLSAMGWPVACTPICKLLGAVGIRRRDGHLFSTTDLRPLLEALSLGELVVVDGRRQGALYRCTDAAAHWAAAAAAREGRLGPLIDALSVSDDARRRRWVYPSDMMREARLLYYVGRPEEADGLVALTERRDGGGIDPSEEGSFARLFGPAAPPEALAVLSPAAVERYLAGTLRRALGLLAPVGPAALAQLGRLPAARRELLVPDAAVVAMLQGDAGACRALAASEPAQPELARGESTPRKAALAAAVHGWVVEALARLVEGDHEAARRAAAAAVDASRGPKGTRKPRIDGSAGRLIALLLATDDGAERRLLGAALLARDLQSTSLQTDSGPLAALAAFLDEGRRPTIPVDRYYIDPARHVPWLETLLWVLLGVWTGQPRRPGKDPQSGHAVDRVVGLAEAGGYRWLAAQLATSEATRVNGRQPPAGSLLSLYRPRPDWERALDALAAVGARVPACPDAGTGAKKGEQRLVWRVRIPASASASELDALEDFGPLDHLEPSRGTGRLSIEPRRQKRRGKGWTPGSGIGLKALREALSGDGLGEEDRRVCAHIAPSSYGRSLDFDEATPLSLVGHPRIVWGDDGRAAEVVAAEPTLGVARDGERLRVRLRPVGVRPGAKIYCEREGDRLLVYRLDDSHHALARAVGEGLDLPAEAEPRLQETLGALAGVAAVESAVAVAGAAAEQTDADPRPVLQLYRARPGLRLRLVVCPLGLDGPALLPGRGPVAIVATVAGRRLQAERDAVAERRLAEALAERCPTLAALDPNGGELSEARLEDLEGCYELLAELARLGDEEVVVAWPEGEPLGVVAERDVRDLRLRLSAGADWFRASGELPVDDQQSLELQALLEALEKSRGRFIELDGGRLLALSEGLRRRLDELAALSRRSRGKLELHPLAALSLEGWAAELAELEADGPARARLARVREAGALAPVVPSTLCAELRDYQREGYDWLCRLAHWGGGACLADDMGLGKTVQVLALLLQRVEGGPALVVAPTSVCATWLEQARRFAPTLRVGRYGDGDREQTLAGLGPYDLLVCSYGLLVRDAEALARVRFHTAVLDEAQAIKNASTQRARAAMTLRADQRLVTTGTPLENHLGELWSQISFCNPGLLGGVRQFEKRYARPIQRDGDRQAARRLRRLLRPFILRRTKAQVLEELPPKTEITLRVPPTPGQLALYEGLRRRALARARRADGDRPQERMRLLADLMKLRRAACHPRLVLGDAAAREALGGTLEGDNLEGAKLEAFEGLVDELRAGGHKALVFSQFVDHLTLARERLDAAGVTYQYLDGSTPVAARERAVAAFQRGEGELFLISLRAGGFGLNLTAADYVIHLDPWWNPAVEDQASDRAHRIGQQRPVTIYRLVTEGTIEERVLALHRDKRELAARMLEGHGQAATLGVDELRELLRD